MLLKREMSVLKMHCTKAGISLQRYKEGGALQSYLTLVGRRQKPPEICLIEKHVYNHVSLLHGFSSTSST